MAVSKFVRGSSTFACNVCGRRTRYNGSQSYGNKICPQCWDLAGLENEISDGHTTLDAAHGDIVRMLKEVKAKGGSLDEWASTFPAQANELEGMFDTHEEKRGDK